MIDGSDSGVPLFGQAVRMEAVDQPIEDDRRDVVGILVADLQARQRLLPLPLDLLELERRIARTTSDSSSKPTPKLSFMTTTLAKLRSLPAPAPSSPPIESIVSAICCGRLSSSCPGRAAQPGSDATPGLAARVGGAAGPHQQAQARRPAARGASRRPPAGRWAACGSRTAETSRRAPAAGAAASRSASPSPGRVRHARHQRRPRRRRTRPTSAATVELPGPA